MSIQTKSYKSKKTGKKTTKYYPVVFDPRSNKSVWGAGYDTRREALKAESKLSIEVDSGLSKSKRVKRELFKDVAKLWFDSSKSRYADSTWRKYQESYDLYIDPLFGEVYIHTIEKKNIIRFKNFYEVERGLAAATINKMINVIVNIFDFAVSLDIIPVSPTTGMKNLRCTVKDSKHSTWTEEQINYFLNLDIVAESHHYAMLIVMFATGARPGEICGLSETDLTNQRVLTLNRGLNCYGNTSTLKNHRSHRPIRLSQPVYDLVRDVLKRKRKKELSKLSNGKEYVSNDFLFVGIHGQPVRPDALYKCFKRLLLKNNEICEEIIKKEGKLPDKWQILPDMRLYDTRHSFATNLMIAGKKDKIIAEVMGNSVKTMQHHYAHVTESMHEEVLEDYGAKIVPLKKA